MSGQPSTFPGAQADRVTQVLVDEHEVILKALAVLDVVCQRLAAGEEVESATAAGLPDFFRRYADDWHHAKEEGVLFPSMQAAGLPANGGPIAVMLHEHDQGRAHVRAMRDTAGELDHPEKRRRFVTAGQEYGALLGQHILKENHVLFRMADQLLAPRAVEIAAELARRDAAGVPAEERARLLAWLDEQAARYL